MLINSLVTDSPTLGFNVPSGGFDNPLKRCVYNLRLLHKFPQEGLEIKCSQLCSGQNRGMDNSLPPCDYFVDFEDYYREICAWKVRSKRLRDRAIAEHGEFKQEYLQPSENYCLTCQGTLDSDCEGYFNVCHVIDEICAHKSKIETNTKRRYVPVESENNCASCPGTNHYKKCNEGFYSSRDHMHFQGLFLPTNPIPKTVLVF